MRLQPEFSPLLRLAHKRLQCLLVLRSSLAPVDPLEHLRSFALGDDVTVQDVPHFSDLGQGVRTGQRVVERQGVVVRIRFLVGGTRFAQNLLNVVLVVGGRIDHAAAVEVVQDRLVVRGQAVDFSVLGKVEVRVLGFGEVQLVLDVELRVVLGRRDLGAVLLNRLLARSFVRPPRLLGLLVSYPLRSCGLAIPQGLTQQHSVQLLARQHAGDGVLDGRLALFIQLRKPGNGLGGVGRGALDRAVFDDLLQVVAAGAHLVRHRIDQGLLQVGVVLERGKPGDLLSDFTKRRLRKAAQNRLLDVLPKDCRPGSCRSDVGHNGAAGSCSRPIAHFGNHVRRKGAAQASSNISAGTRKSHDAGAQGGLPRSRRNPERRTNRRPDTRRERRRYERSRHQQVFVLVLAVRLRGIENRQSVGCELYVVERLPVALDGSPKRRV